MQFDRDALSKFDEMVKNPDLILMCHSNADADAICSAISIKLSLAPNALIMAPDTVSALGKRLMALFNLNYIIPSGMEEVSSENTIVLDTSTIAQLPGFEDLLENSLVIDHHLPNENISSKKYISDPESSSCCEVVLKLLERNNWEKQCGSETVREVSRSLIFGIIADTGHLRFSKPSTFSNLIELLEKSELSIEEAMQVLEERESNVSKTIAVLKAVQRLKYQRIGSYIMSSSRVNSFESAACQAMIAMGSHVAIVVSKNKKLTRASARARRTLINKGLRLNIIMEEVANKFSCQGGGHDGAAGLNGKADPIAVMEELRNVTIKKLRDILSQEKD